MNSVFLGGSRHVSRLSAEVKERLNNVTDHGHRVLVGDANGADKAVQKHLSEAGYNKVTVFCSGEHPRNNVGHWQIRHVTPPKNANGFQFYAAKDREMPREADFGLMIWDSKSAGTVLNVLRLVRAGKIAVLINVPDNTTLNIKSLEQWNEFLSRCGTKLRDDLLERATPDEREILVEPNLFDRQVSATLEASREMSEEELTTTLNEALATGDSSLIVDALGSIARTRGMTQVAKETGLARESLYRSLVNGGNPEFATVLKVLAAVGLRLEASKAETSKVT